MAVTVRSGQAPRIVVVGIGGLGCPILLQLLPRLFGATFVLVDPDRVEASNLQRQILFGDVDVGRLKVEVAAEYVRSQGAQAEPHAVRLDATTAELLAGADVIVDGTDSLETKFFCNDQAVARAIALVHGGVVGWRGQLMTVLGDAACYRCLFEAPPTADELPPTCATAGIVGAFAGFIGGRMADEVLAVLAGTPRLAGAIEVITVAPLAPLSERLNVRILPLRRRPGCPAHRPLRLTPRPGDPMATVRIPTPLRKLTGGQEEVTVDGRTIGELITNLEARFPGIKERICDDKGAVRRFVNIFVKDEDVRFLQQLDTAVADGDEVSIVPAIAGG